MFEWKETNVAVTKDIDPDRSEILEWYLIARKFVDRIELLVIDGFKLEKRIKNNTLNGILTKGSGNFSISKLEENIDGNFISKFTIDLTNIDGRINNLGENLKSYLDQLYEELSNFQYNIETIVTGINEKGKVIKNQSEFETYYNAAQNNVNHLKDHLEKLVSEINR